MSENPGTLVWLGKGDNEEKFLDGKFTVFSRDGLFASERAILPVLPKEKSGKALVINSRFGVLAHAFRALNPEAEVTCFFDDQWDADRAAETLSKSPDEKISIVVSHDIPDGVTYNFIIMPLERQGIADLVRNRIRSAANDWLAPKGLLYSSSDTTDDKFIREEIRKAFGSVAMTPEPGRRKKGVGYVARKPAQSLVGSPRMESSFTVREGEEVITIESLVGVFCHDKLDDGTRALLALAEVGEAKRILDLGCGSGVVGIVASMRAPEAQIIFIDSNARAVACARKNAEKFGIAERSEILISSQSGEALKAMEPVDLVLTNPPYYGNLRIAEMFVDTAFEVLKPGGSLQLVTKSPDWYRERLAGLFTNLREEKRGGYFVLFADKQ